VRQASLRATTWVTAILGVLVPTTALAQSDVAFSPEVYEERRAALFGQTGGAPIIVPGEYMIRHGGALKQDPDFWYLTGVESPWALLVIVPRADGGRRDVLFLPDAYQFAGAQYPMVDDRFREAAWNQPIRRLEPGPSAEASTGIPETFPIDELGRRLPELAGAAGEVYFASHPGELYVPPGMGQALSYRQQLKASVQELLPGRSLRDVTPLVRRMRLVKDEHEIAALRKAAEISALSLVEAMRAIRPGMNDLELAGLMEYVWRREGSPRNSFGPIVASGPSAVSLYTLRSENYRPVYRVMQEGELVFIDYGAAEWDMYTSDVCRTFPVSGRFTPRQREVYEVVLEALYAALATIRPGVMKRDVIRAAAGVFQAHGYDDYEDIETMGVERVWGLMPSPTYWIERDGGHTDYSGARGTGVRDLGHHVGLDALDSRDYSMPLEPGMVFTVEPKIYIPDEGIAIMIEEVVLVTEDGYENLSASAPTTVEEIERVMAERSPLLR
jgi:Xaa-Pro aminopeptidase